LSKAFFLTVEKGIVMKKVSFLLMNEYGSAGSDEIDNLFTQALPREGDLILVKFEDITPLLSLSDWEEITASGHSAIPFKIGSALFNTKTVIVNLYVKLAKDILYKKGG
jgi:hypothetical protein